MPMVNMGELFAFPRILPMKMDRVLVGDKERSFILQDGDLLYARQSLVFEGAGKCSIFLGGHEPTVFESHIIRCRLNRRKADPLFYFFFFQSPLGRDAISSIVEQGAGAAGIRASDLAKILVPVPPLPFQLVASSVLNALDERIETLRRANSSLEAIARAIFKSWFVDFDPVRAKAEGREPDGMDAATAALFPGDFVHQEDTIIPAGWTEGTLGDVCEVARTGVQKTEMRPDENYVGLEHIPRVSWSLPSWGTAKDLQSGKSRFQQGDILFGKLRPYFHKVCIAPVDGVCSTDILVLRPKNPEWMAFALCHVSSKQMIDYATRLSNGAKMPRSSWHDLNNYKVILPPESLAEAFTSIIEPIVEKIIANVHTAASLTALRDTLLPRLISGKLRVPEAEAMLMEVV